MLMLSVFSGLLGHANSSTPTSLVAGVNYFTLSLVGIGIGTRTPPYAPIIH